MPFSSVRVSWWSHVKALHVFIFFSWMVQRGLDATDSIEKGLELYHWAKMFWNERCPNLNERISARYPNSTNFDRSEFAYYLKPRGWRYSPPRTGKSSAWRSKGAHSSVEPASPTTRASGIWIFECGSHLTQPEWASLWSGMVSLTSVLTRIG